VALTYHTTADVPACFRKSKVVGAVFRLTCPKYQSGEIDRSGRISRCGDEMMGVMLYEASGGYNAEPSRPHPLRELCYTLWCVQRLSQPLKAMRRVAMVPADASAKQPRRTAITAANLAPECT
jgi:transposase